MPLRVGLLNPGISWISVLDKRPNSVSLKKEEMNKYFKKNKNLNLEGLVNVITEILSDTERFFFQFPKEK